MRILIVEDDPDTQANLCDVLRLDDYETHVCGSMAEALGRDDLPSFGAVVLDRKLPEGNAEEFLPRLKQLSPQTDVIIATAYADMEGVVAALRHGAVDYPLTVSVSRRCFAI